LVEIDRIALQRFISKMHAPLSNELQTLQKELVRPR